MSMVSPDYFVEEYKDMTYEELLPVRDELIEDIREFEKKGPGVGGMQPSPNTMYQVRLEYLGKLCELIASKFQDLQWQ